MKDPELRIQDYVSLAYLFLLILGVLRESIFYGLMGINILNYSHIMDILLGPIAYMANNPILSLLVFLLFYWVAIQRRIHKTYREKKWYKKMFNVEKRDQTFAKSNLVARELPILALAIACLLLGTGIGAGFKMKNRIASGELRIRDRITFQDNEEEKVSIVGQNTGYIFYVRAGQNKLAISPINGTIKRIEENVFEDETEE